MAITKKTAPKKSAAARKYLKKVPVVPGKPAHYVMGKTGLDLIESPTCVHGIDLAEARAIYGEPGTGKTATVEVLTPAEEIMKILSTFSHSVQNDIIAEVLRNMAASMRSKLEATRSEYEVSDKSLSEFYNIVNGGYEKTQKGTVSFVNDNKASLK